MIAKNRNNIVLIKMDNPKKVTLPNGRTFYAKYKRVSQQYLPGSAKIQRTYTRRPVEPIARTPAHLHKQKPLQIRALNSKRVTLRRRKQKMKERGFADVAKTIASNPYMQEIDEKITTKGIEVLPKLYKRATNRIKNDNLRDLAQCDVANYIIERGVEKGIERLI